jgi:hypothetical protein
MNEDPLQILGGVRDREFQLKLIDSSGPGRPQYQFIHHAEDSTDDPFKDTVMVEWGRVVPVSPKRKLKPWKYSEERDYRRVIAEQLAGSDLNVVRLTGEKVFEQKTEWITMFLIPDAIEWQPNVFQHLIFVTCQTSNGAADDSFRRRLMSLFLQDGTAHGNPKRT